MEKQKVLGFKHDNLVDKTVYGGTHEKASISFEFLDFMIGETYKSMNSENDNTGGWRATQMRKDINGYTTSDVTQSKAIGGLGENLNNKGYIKQVKKKYIEAYNDVNSVATCNDYLWLLAASEIVNSGYASGAYGVAITSEGSQYKYYQKLTETYNTASTNRIKKTSYTGSTNDWWLRSPRYDGNNGFCFVNGEGYVYNHINARYTCGVAPRILHLARNS